MFRSTATGCLLAMAISVACAQTSTPAVPADPQSRPPAAAPANGPVIPVELAKGLDSKKVKQGDEVIAQTSMDMKAPDGSSIPHGSKVVGHVTQASARSNGNPDSTLGISFEKIAVKGGKELPLKAVIQAIAPPLAPGAPSGRDMSGATGTSIRPNTNDGHREADNMGDSITPSTLPGRQGRPNDPQPGTVSRGGASPSLTGSSVGVIGISGLEMGDNSLLLSTGKAVKLESGTRMVLRVQSQ